MLSDIHKLVYCTHPTHNGPVANGNVTGYLHTVTQNAVIANDAVVGNMTIRHYQTIISYHGFAPVGGTAVDGYKFTDGSVIAYFSGGFFAIIF